MNIALYHNLPSGGAKRSLYEAVRRLSERHSIHSFIPETANQDFCDYSEYIATTTVIPFRLSRRIKRPLGRLNNAVLLFDLMRLAKLEQDFAQRIDQNGYDIVLVHPSQWTQAPSLLRRLKSSSLYYCHEPLRHVYETDQAQQASLHKERFLIKAIDPLPRILDGYVTRNDRLATQSASCVATNSVFTASEIDRIYGVHAQVAYHGVDTETFRPLNLEREPFVLSVGALLPHKGFDFLIRSLGQIAEKHRPPLVIVSNNASLQEQRRLDLLASGSRVRVTYLSQVSVEDLVQLYNRCQLVVYTPYREPFGLVPLEAMACGTPVVALREGGPAESILHHETGILVDRDESQFAGSIDALLQDATERKRLGSQAVVYVKLNWTWDRAIERLEHILSATAQNPSVDTEIGQDR